MLLLLFISQRLFSCELLDGQSSHNGENESQNFNGLKLKTVYWLNVYESV